MLTDSAFLNPALLFAALAIFLAIFVRTLTGFGAALVMVPLLSLVWDLRDVVLIAALIQAATGFPIAMQARKSADRRVLVTLLVGSLVGLLLGALLLMLIPLPWLRRGLGVITLAFGLSRFTPVTGRGSLSGRWLSLAAVPVGFVSGLLTGAIGTGGPPVVAYLHYRLQSVAARRATLLLYFMVLDLLRLPGYLRLGVGSVNLLWVGAALLPFAILGIVAGGLAFGRLSEQAVSRATAGVLVLTGILLLR